MIDIGRVADQSRLSRLTDQFKSQIILGQMCNYILKKKKKVDLFVKNYNS